MVLFCYNNYMWCKTIEKMAQKRMFLAKTCQKGLAIIP